MTHNEPTERVSELEAQVKLLDQELSYTRKRLSYIREQNFEKVKLDLKIHKLHKEVQWRDRVITRLNQSGRELSEQRKSNKILETPLVGLDVLCKELEMLPDENTKNTNKSKSVKNYRQNDQQIVLPEKLPEIDHNNWPLLLESVNAIVKPSLKCTVVIPCFNNQSQLNTALRWLSVQSYPSELLEIILADDGSEIPIYIEKEFANLDIKLVAHERRGFRLAAIRNLGASAGCGDILLFLDSDLLPCPDWVMSHALWHHAYPRCVTVGRRYYLHPDQISDPVTGSVSQSREDHQDLIDSNSAPPNHWIEQVRQDTAMYRKDDGSLISVCSGCNIGYTRESFEMVGGFNEAFDCWGGEDNELASRLYTYGSVIVPCDGARTIHHGVDGMYGPEGEELVSYDEQRQLMRDLIPYHAARESRTSQAFTVPKLVINILCSLEPDRQIIRTIDSALSTGQRDIRINVDFEFEHPMLKKIQKRYRGDARVVIGQSDGAANPVDQFSAYVAMTRPCLQFQYDSISSILEFIKLHELGGVVLSDPLLGEVPAISIFQQRALNRAKLYTEDSHELVEIADQLFRVVSLQCDEMGVQLQENFQVFDSAPGSDGYNASNSFNAQVFHPTDDILLDPVKKLCVLLHVPTVDSLGAVEKFCLANNMECDAFYPASLEIDNETLSRMESIESLVVKPFAVKVEMQVYIFKQYMAILDHSTFHASILKRASWLMRQCAAGVPVLLLDDGSELTGLMSSELLTRLRLQSWEKLSCPASRRMTRHEVSREAIKHHGDLQFGIFGLTHRVEKSGSGSIVQQPLISILCVTKRPEYLSQFLKQVNVQTYDNVELILVLHGNKEKFSAIYSTIEFNRPVKVLFASPDCNFGETLNLALGSASGRYVTKMDDDDWYYPDHLYDLMIAHSHSHAQVVGKAGEFVYLSDLDMTIQRKVKPMYGYVKNFLAGGAMFMERIFLESIGGWHNVDKEVDRYLIEDVLKTGGRLYRCNSLGFVLNRHNTDHTWKVENNFFLHNCIDTRKGLDLEFSGFPELVTNA